MTTIDDFAQAAADIAMQAAATYLQIHELTADQETLCSCIQSRIRIKFPEALMNAKKALDTNVVQVAEATFTESMAQVGIEAAKEATNQADFMRASTPTPTTRSPRDTARP